MRLILPFLLIALIGILSACGMVEDNMQTEKVNYKAVRHDYDHDGKNDLMDTQIDRERAEMMDGDYFSPDGNYDKRQYRSSDPYKKKEWRVKVIK